MSDSDLKLRIEGPDADGLADELSLFLETEFGTRPTRRRDEERAQRTAVLRGDPLALVAVALAIPGTILAASDLARRLELRQKAEKLIAWARGKTAADGGTRVEVIDGNGRARPLDQIEASEVLEIAVTITARVTRRTDR